MFISTHKFDRLRREFGRKNHGDSLIGAVAKAMGDRSRRAYHILERARAGKEVSAELGTAFIAALSTVLGREIEQADILQDEARGASGKRGRASIAT